jgi:hypothetical protein
MSPPFGGRNGHVPWLRRFLDHRDGVAIVRAYTSSAWFHRYAVHAETMLFPKGKTKFIRPDGSVGRSPGHGVVLLGVGEVANDALRNSGLGFVVGGSGARKAERQWYHHSLHLPGLDDALMADSKSCDEVHPAGTHMGRCPWLTVPLPPARLQAHVPGG